MPGSHTAHTLVFAVLLSAVTLAQAPNFAGKWAVVADPASQGPGGLGQSAVIKQDATTLTVTRTTQMGEVTSVYKLDGSESKNMNPTGIGQADEPIFSHASWDGDKLVILTRGTALVNGKQLETKRVIWLEKDGLLTIERSAEGAPTLRSVYQRSK